MASYKNLKLLPYIRKSLAELERVAEVGWQEKRTTAYVKKYIKIEPYRDGFGEEKVGVLYKLQGKINERREPVLLRADIDALKKSDGSTSHLCGHNGHTVALILACHYGIRLYKENKIKSPIYFLFQPAEECYPSGASAALAECKNEFGHLDYVFGAHIYPGIPLGKICLQEKVVFAAGDYFEIEIQGKSVHVKDTASAVDALLASSEFICRLHTHFKNYQGFGRDFVCNTGTVHGGTAANRTVGSVKLTGDIRCFDTKYRELLQRDISRILSEVDAQFGTKSELSYFVGTPSLYNNPKLTQLAKELYKDSDIYRSKIKDLATEDFAYFSSQFRTLYALVGTSSESNLHEDSYEVQVESVLYMYEYFTRVIDAFAC